MHYLIARKNKVDVIVVHIRTKQTYIIETNSHVKNKHYHGKAAHNTHVINLCTTAKKTKMIDLFLFERLYFCD